MAPPLPATHAPSHQRRKAERPQALIEAALELFSEKGYAATRTEEVAHRAGVSKGTLYLYFPSKEELFKAVIRESLGHRIEAGRRQVEDHEGSCASLLRNLLTAWWGEVLLSDASRVFKLIVSEVRNFPEVAGFYFNEVAQPGERLLAKVIERGIAAGEFRPVHVENTVHSLVLPMVMLCVHRHSLGACDIAKGLEDPLPFIHDHMDLVLRGLCRNVDTPATTP